MKHNTAILVIGLLALLFITACEGEKPEPVRINIDMSEFAFTPDTIELRVGQEVTFNLINKGALSHEIMIGRDVMMMGGQPGGYQVDFFETVGVEPSVAVAGGEEMGMAGHDTEATHSGFMVSVPENGGAATVKFTVTDEMVGEWEIGCFAQEGVHYTAGMDGILFVKP